MSRTCTEVLKSLTLGGLMLAATAATASASPPEMVMQMRNTSAPDGCIDPLRKAGLVSYFRQELVASLEAAEKEFPEEDRQVPNPHVITVPCANGKELIGVWLKQPLAYGAGDTLVARRAALAAVNILSGSETFGVRVTKEALSRKVGETLDRKGRRLNTAGQPDTDGSVFLDSHSLDFWTGHVRTTIAAHMEIPVWWDFYFEVVQQDNLALQNGQVICTSEDPTVEDDSTWYDIFQLVTGNFLDVLTQVVLNDYTFTWLDRKISAGFGQGPGCGIAAGIPTKIMLPGTDTNFLFGEHAHKLVMSYSRLSINNDTGMTAGGSYSRLIRQPSVAIGLDGGNPIRSDTNQYTGKFRYWDTDLRPPFKSVVYSASGGATVTSNGRITWTLSSQPGPGGSQQWARVTITDADGLTASAVMVVRLDFSLTPDLPPICDQHPTHYECN